MTSRIGKNYIKVKSGLQIATAAPVVVGAGGLIYGEHSWSPEDSQFDVTASFTLQQRSTVYFDATVRGQIVSPDTNPNNDYWFSVDFINDWFEFQSDPIYPTSWNTMDTENFNLYLAGVQTLDAGTHNILMHWRSLGSFAHLNWSVVVGSNTEQNSWF